MRLLKVFSTCLLISILSVNTLEAQLLKKLKKKVQEATEDVIAEKAAQKAEQETGEALDSLLELDPDYEANYQKQLNQMMAAGSENIPIEESYSFDTKVVYKMTTSDKDKSSVVNYEMWFAEESGYMATKVNSNEAADHKDMPSSMLTILDDKNQAIIIIMETEKIAQVLSMPRLKEISVDENETETTATDFDALQKTGNSKKILGYVCEEFTSQNDSNRFTIWITKELELFQKNMFYNLSKSLGGNTFEKIPESAQGFMMEMNFENLSNNEKGHMIVTSIEQIKKTITMDEYQLMNLGQFMQK